MAFRPLRCRQKHPAENSDGNAADDRAGGNCLFCSCNFAFISDNACVAAVLSHECLYGYDFRAFRIYNGYFQRNGSGKVIYADGFRRGYPVFPPLKSAVFPIPPALFLDRKGSSAEPMSLRKGKITIKQGVFLLNRFWRALEY